MKKKMMLSLLTALCSLLTATAQDIRPVTWQEQARWGATHSIEVRARDMTNAAANAPQVFTAELAGPCQYRFASAALDAPFSASLVTNAVSATLTASVAGVNVVSGASVTADPAPQVAWAPATYAWTALTNGATATVTLTFSAPGAGVAWKEFDRGRARVFLHVLRP